jgi:hypothetical protein
VGFPILGRRRVVRHHACGKVRKIQDIGLAGFGIRWQICSRPVWLNPWTVTSLQDGFSVHHPSTDHIKRRSFSVLSLFAFKPHLFSHGRQPNMPESMSWLVLKQSAASKRRGFHIDVFAANPNPRIKRQRRGDRRGNQARDVAGDQKSPVCLVCKMLKVSLCYLIPLPSQLSLERVVISRSDPPFFE